MNKINLAGLWDVRSSCGRYTWKGEVPGSVLLDMESMGKLGEHGAFYRDNNRKAVEIMNRDFLYSTTIIITDDFLKNNSDRSSRFFLETDGLDTLTELKVNGTVVGNTNNMHRAFQFNIDNLLRTGENHIEIRFFNSLEYIKREHLRRPLVSEDEEGVTTIPGFYSIRKSHCSFGWDWGPQMPDAGIWRPIRIVRYDDCQLKNLRILQDLKEDHVILTLNAEAEQWGDKQFKIVGHITAPSGDKIPFTFNVGEQTSIQIDKPELWWPNGMGNQPLYRIEGDLVYNNIIFDSIEKNIGIRTLTIIQEPDEWGESFQFEANGVSLFARGANYIPEDVFLNRMTKEKTEKLLRDCVAANFNCIRVWGGGVFPDDYFYDLCDKYGLIVWQDMMFACAIYDIRNDEFSENISSEIRDNLERIRHHASLGLICGNNEMEWFFVDYDSFPQSKENEFEYIKQYHMIIPAVHKEVCPEIFYWSSSPSSGGYFEEPNSPDKGDCHFWDVWHGNKDFNEYKKHYFRFMSEFGFESLPAMKTIESFTKEGDRNIFSPVMEEHQKRVGGNPKIVSYLSKYFRYPKDLDSLAYVSQLSQSDAIRYGVEHWRRNRGRCMGSLYWQLNDNWPVASWSSIDYYGRWKSLHYSVKRAYDNTLISIDGDEKAAEVHLSNEGGETVGGELDIKLYTLSGEVLYTTSLSVSADRRSSKKLFDFDLLNSGIDCSGKDVIFTSTMTGEGGDRYSAFHNFVPYKYLDLENPQISYSLADRGANGVEITLKSEKPALYVEVLTAGEDLVFSDNYFQLMPEEEQVIQIKGISLDKLKDSMKIRSLYDSYI